MILRYEKLDKNNIVQATKIQYEIFPNSCAYSKYLEEINTNNELPINFLVFEDSKPIGVVGLYDIHKYNDTIWLSWFGVLKQYRFKGYGTQIFNDIIRIAKKYNKKFLRLYTYEKWNYEAQNFYKKHMQIGEYYTNINENQYDIKVGKCKIFGYSLCREKIKFWNNKFINISEEEHTHKKSILMMKKDGIIV